MELKRFKMFAIIVSVIYISLIAVFTVRNFYVNGFVAVDFEVSESNIRFFREDELARSPKLEKLNAYSRTPKEVLVWDAQGDNNPYVESVRLNERYLYLEEIFSYRNLSQEDIYRMEKYPTIKIFCPESNHEFIIHKQRKGSYIKRIIF